MVDRLCTSLAGLSLSAIRRYTALAAEREDCIALTIGEPDLPSTACTTTAAGSINTLECKSISDTLNTVEFFLITI